MYFVCLEELAFNNTPHAIIQSYTHVLGSKTMNISDVCHSTTMQVEAPMNLAHVCF